MSFSACCIFGYIFRIFRFIDVATNKVAVVACVGAGLISTGASMIGVSDQYWDRGSRRCFPITTEVNQYIMYQAYSRWGRSRQWGRLG